MLRCKSRVMVCADEREVLAIEKASWKHPTPDDDFRKAWRRPNVFGRVVEYGHHVVGFYLYSGHRNHVNLIDLAVDPDWRCQGVGRQLIVDFKTIVLSDAGNWASLVVRETELDAQTFLRHMKFHATEVIRGHYADTGEDAYVMRYPRRPPDPIPAWATESDGTRDCGGR